MAPAVVNRFRNLNTSLSRPRSLLCTRLMRSRSWIRCWQLWLLISGIIFVTLLCIFSILSISRLKCEDQNWTACSRCGQTRDLYNGRISSLFLYLKLRAINPSTLLAVLQLFSVCFCHLRSLVMMIPIDPAVDLLSATVNWTCYSYFSCCLINFGITAYVVACQFIETKRVPTNHIY